MKNMRVIIGFFYLMLVVVHQLDAKCSMLHICNTNPNGQSQNCINYPSADPIKLDSSIPKEEEAREKLKEYCPFFFEDDSGNKIENPDLCCDADQALTMIDGFKSTAPFARCPSCVQNVIKVYCVFSCSPIQDEFTTLLVPWINYTSFDEFNIYAAIVYQNINENFIQDVYDSCKDVANPSAGGTLMGSTCGAYGAANCDPKKFFDFMGASENGLAPFTIIFNLVNDSVPSINQTALRCDQAYVFVETYCRQFIAPSFNIN